ncbi:NUDIX domain-containing protein [Frankia sp. Cas3]|uniref:NUDIX domain-containing protein n=1 Tax=Frankia sp. Cas3 TaxID=3073926 RepID=UPI002AD4CDCF|nr:NUDIX domain-containing protein [Frankia sp. Cas3]
MPVTPNKISARIVFLTRDRVLLANRRGESWYFLPGGHVAAGETVEVALRRETTEATGLHVGDLQFLGCAEHSYQEKGIRVHELNVLFVAELPWGAEIGSREDDVHITSIAIGSLDGIDLRPVSLTSAIIEWRATHRPLWRGTRAGR